jgi:hypothetical protein
VARGPLGPASSSWTRYAPKTGGILRRCGACGTETEQPGPHGWWWRPRPALERGPDRRRSTESLCGACAPALLRRSPPSSGPPVGVGPCLRRKVGLERARNA